MATTFDQNLDCEGLNVSVMKNRISKIESLRRNDFPKNQQSLVGDLIDIEDKFTCVKATSSLVSGFINPFVLNMNLVLFGFYQEHETSKMTNFGI